MAKNFFSGLFGKKKNDDTPSEDRDVDKAADEPRPPTAEDDISNDAAAAVAHDASLEAATLQRPEDAASLSDKGHDDAGTDETGVADDPSADGAAIAEEEPAPSSLPPAPSQAELSGTETPDPQSPAPAPEPEKKGFFSRLKDGLSKTSSRISDGVASIFTKRKLDDETLEELEDLLISADLGVASAARVTQALAKDRYDKEISDDEVKNALADEV
ncbi:MAG: signal recognition particle receptor subunit alpha, partial [Pseudomonadota bacterium]